jgi:hypothetical protein
MSEKEEYVAALQWRLEELRALIENDQLQVRELLQTIEEKERQADYILKLLEAEDVELAEDVLDIAPKSVSDMAYEVLSSLDGQRPLHYRELADLIMAEGKHIPGQDPAANLISHLGRDERFVRTGRGIYGLAEWGLEIPRKTKPRRRTRRK